MASVVIETESFSDPGLFSKTKMIVDRFIPRNVFLRNASMSTISRSLNSFITPLSALAYGYDLLFLLTKT
jgi:hypothetical protein